MCSGRTEACTTRPRTDKTLPKVLAQITTDVFWVLDCPIRCEFDDHQTRPCTPQRSGTGLKRCPRPMSAKTSCHRITNRPQIRSLGGLTRPSGDKAVTAPRHDAVQRPNSEKECFQDPRIDPRHSPRGSRRSERDHHQDDTRGPHHHPCDSAAATIDLCIAN
jgi:hypothetical protein